MIKALFSFNGRINRAKFFWYGILLSIFILVITGVSSAIFELILLIDVDTSAMLSNIIALFLSAYPSLALIIKRFHDIDKNGLRYVPFFGS